VLSQRARWAPIPGRQETIPFNSYLEVAGFGPDEQRAWRWVSLALRVENTGVGAAAGTPVSEDMRQPEKLAPLGLPSGRAGPRPVTAAAAPGGIGRPRLTAGSVEDAGARRKGTGGTGPSQLGRPSRHSK
jgi:hypothetical protein